MLVVISDLHLCDGSAAPNVNPGAFGIWLHEILDLAETNQAEKIILLYLGDIFDLLRTEHWFYPAPGGELISVTAATKAPSSSGASGTTVLPEESFPLGDRPWGKASVNSEGHGRPSDACLKRAHEIFDRITKECRDQLAFLRGDFAALGDPCRKLAEPMRDKLDRWKDRIHRLYVPGNHDRLYLHEEEGVPADETLKGRMLEALGAKAIPEGEGGPHAFVSAEYGVIARHGHEWDVWNYEGREERPASVLDRLKAFITGRPPTRPDFSDASHKLVPIGDPITTELVTRLPYAMYQKLSEKPELAKRVHEHLMQIEDVRPLHAAIGWVVTHGHDVGGEDELLVRQKLEEVIKETAIKFMNVPFVKRWLEYHDRFDVWLDEADKLQTVADMLEKLHLGEVQDVLAVVDRLEALMSGKEDPDKAALSDPALGQMIRYCVYGHTHNFRHEPLGVGSSGDESVYFNSGTWRKRVVRTRDKKDFVGYKDIAYLVFYDKDEDDPALKQGTSYEAWHGVMLKRER